MNHTGVYGTGLRRQARRKALSSPGPEAAVALACGMEVLSCPALRGTSWACGTLWMVPRPGGPAGTGPRGHRWNGPKAGPRSRTM
ncbi:hypothetical protein GCM10010151_14860 [Actinoallomurus spadix]|uniref:Uncharacterized protein n=1 Tax=Actinoallomurus spadix TaxID=79912 RepID=A0ABN0W5L2_9ACTN